MRDRLIKLLKQAEKQQSLNAVCGDIDSLIDSPKGAEFIADYLLANGGVALPCKVGQLAYCIIKGRYHSQLMHGTVLRVEISKDGVFFMFRLTDILDNITHLQMWAKTYSLHERKPSER